MRSPILIAAALLGLAAAPAAAASPETCVAEIKAVVADSFQHGPFEMTGTLDGPLTVTAPLP